MTTPLLEVHGLARRFGDRAVLRGVELTVHPGEHVALVGNNGQGKTTLLQLILGLLPADAGTVRLAGRELRRPRAAEDKRRIGYLPEAVQFYPRLTGRATLHFLGRLKGLRGKALRTDTEVLLARVGLDEAAGRPVGTYSKGMRQRLGLAQALLGGPRLLLLDEPTNGLDPEGTQAFYALLAELQRDGVGILMASHSLAEIEPRMGRLAVLQGGVIARAGTLAELTAQAGLPTRIQFKLRADADTAEALPAELAALVGRAQRNGAPHGYWLEVDAGRKLAVLQDLVRHEAQVASVTVHEPGLEALFRHMHTMHPATAGEERP